MTGRPALRSGLAVRLRLGALLALGLLAACGESEAPDDDLSAVKAPEVARVVPAGEALAGAEIRKLDPAKMNDAEIRGLLGAGPYCAFRYTSDGAPVLAVGWTEGGAGAEAAVKLNGSLVALGGTPADGSVTLSAQEVRLALSPDGPLVPEPSPGSAGEASGEQEPQEAELLFEVGEELTVGYRGYYTCHPDTR